MFGTATLRSQPIAILAVTAWLVAIACLVLPRVVLGAHSFIDPWDYLDSYHAWKVILVRAGGMFAAWNAQIPGVFDTGMPRVSFGTQFDVQGLAYLAFSPYWATVVLEIIARAIGFWGMYRLVAHQLLAQREDRIIIALVAATTFSLINYIPGTFLSLIGLPLLLSSLIAIATRSASPFDFVYVLIFPFASSLPVVGVFVIALLGLVCLAFLVLRRWSPFLRLAAAAAVLAIGYVVADHGLIMLKLTGAFETQRSLLPPRETSWGKTVKDVTESFVTGRFHTTVGISPWLFIVCLAGVAAEWWTVLRGRTLAQGTLDVMRQVPVTTCLAAIFLFCVLAYVPATILERLAVFPALRQFNLHRWLWLAQPIFYVAFGLAAVQVVRVLTRGRSALVVVIVTAIVLLPQYALLIRKGVTTNGLVIKLTLLARSGELGPFAARVAGSVGPNLPSHAIGLSYDEYYSPGLFGEIERMLGRPRAETRVASIGIDPFIASVNGFEVTEGYFQILPLADHARLSAVQHAEVMRGKRISKDFNQWGNRAYLFSSELYAEGNGCRTHCLADRAPTAITLQYDAAALHALNIDAVLSVSDITNADALGLQPVGIARDAASPWRLFVYRVVNPAPAAKAAPAGPGRP